MDIPKNTPKIQRDPRWWDPLAAFLLLAALLLAAGRLISTGWTYPRGDLGVAQNLVFLGSIAGLALGKSRFSPRFAVIIAVVYGLFFIPWQMGLTLVPDVEWRERIFSLAGRLQITITQLFQDKPVTDDIFFVLLMSCLYWTLSIHAGYTLVRYSHPWRTILPAGLAVLIIQIYDPLLTRRSWYLAGYLFFALLIVARLTYIQQNRRWQQNQTYIPPDVGYDLTRFTFIAATIIVLFAWTAPVSAAILPTAAEIKQAISRPWNTVRDRLSHAFASLSSSVGIVKDYYGTDLVLGRGNVLSDNKVMTVQAPRLSYAGGRYYWQARVYDQYVGGEWTSNYTQVQKVSSNQPDLNIGPASGRVVVIITFTPSDAIATLYTVPEPLWVSRPADAQLITNPDGTVDLASYEATPYLRAGEQYQVRSSISTVTVAQLRKAGVEYPSWVTQRYLQLPASITQRTKDLANQVASGLNNPYDIADTVTQYLRANIQYEAIIPSPQSGQEPIDWFLFDYGKGFCNYYASAEVILLRSLGIPARLAVGYAQGEPQPSTEEAGLSQLGVPQPQLNVVGSDTYTVRQRDAHAWPEVYFPGIGWVEFEPTASQQPVIRPLGQGPDSVDNSNQPNDTIGHGNPVDRPDPEQLRRLQGGTVGLYARRMTVGLILLSVFVFMALCIVAFLIIWRVHYKRSIRELFHVMREDIQNAPPLPVQLERGIRRLGLRPPSFLLLWAHYISLPPLSRAYLEINRALKRLGKAPTLEATPAERASVLVQILPEAAQPIQKLLSEYHTAAYSPFSADYDSARQAGQEIRRLSYLALLQRLLIGLQEPRRAQRSPVKR